MPDRIKVLQTSWAKPLLLSKLLRFPIYILLPSTFLGPSQPLCYHLEDVPFAWSMEYTTFYPPYAFEPA